MSKTTMSKNEIEQKIRDLKTKLSCQESDIGDWKIAKCIEYSTLGWSHLMTFRNSTNRDRSSVMRLEPWKRNLPSVKMRMKPLLKSRRYSQNYCQKKRRVFPSVSCL